MPQKGAPQGTVLRALSEQSRVTAQIRMPGAGKAGKFLHQRSLGTLPFLMLRVWSTVPARPQQAIPPPPPYSGAPPAQRPTPR